MNKEQRWKRVIATGLLAAATASPLLADDQPEEKVEQKIVSTVVVSDDSAPADGQKLAVVVADPAGGGQELPPGTQPRVFVRTLGVGGGGGGGGGATVSSGGPNARFMVTTVEDDQPSSGGGGSDAAWLGVSTEEPSEALTSQLGLRAGEGLLVTYLAPDGPAAKAGLQKNDLLTDVDGQRLVLSAQLRKLVRMHKEGEKIELAFFRGGKKQTLTAILGKAATGYTLIDDTQVLKGLKDTKVQLREILNKAGADWHDVEGQVRREVDEASHRVAAAMADLRAKNFRDRYTVHVSPPVPAGVEVDKDAKVTVKSHTGSVRTIVNTDDTGTYVIVASPNKRLTVHDKDGKLAFDGEIETTEQQAKVPREIWSKVEPMLGQMDQVTPPPAPGGPPGSTTPPPPPPPPTPARKTTT